MNRPQKPKLTVQPNGLPARRRVLDDDTGTAGLLRILQLEADVRRVPTERELVFHLANESRNVLGYRQSFVLRCRRSWKLEAISSVSNFDRQAPINRQIEKLATSLSALPGAEKVQRIKLSEHANAEALKYLVFDHAVWIPLKTRRGHIFGAALILTEKEWPDTMDPLAQRVSEVYEHAWQAIAGEKLDRRKWISKAIAAPLILTGLLLLGFVKAPLTVHAPAEVAGQDRRTVAAPLNGAIEDVAVAPNSIVEPGTLLARYDDTELRNALEIAEREVIVSRAKLEKLQNASFADREAAGELKIAEAELLLAIAESDLARERFSRVDIVARTAGIAVFEDTADLVGRPVVVGERLMDIVNPKNLEFNIRLPVSDSIVLQEGARVRVFLDSDPLKPVDATLIRRSYRATSHEDGSFAYTLVAAASAGGLDSVRIGGYGTAQLFGNRHSLYFIVFRRPFSWLRQTFGF